MHDLEKENIVLKNRVEESSHKGKVELTNLKMDMLKERGDMERQRDKLINQLEGQTRFRIFDIPTHNLTHKL